MIAVQRGFGAIVAIVIVVILAGVSAAMVRMATTQQLTSTQDILSARAMQTARAGTEWGLYQALSAGACSAATTLDLRAETGFSVSVSCSARTFNEGESSPGVPLVVTTYVIEAIACNSGTCPDAALVATPGYVERKRQVMANAP